MGRLDDLLNNVDVLAWPALTTVASLLSRRLGRLVRPLTADINAEADPIG